MASAKHMASLRYAKDFHRDDEVSLPYDLVYTWNYVSTNMRQMVNEGIMPGVAESECMVSFIAAPTLKGAVAEANFRYRVECAVRGIDA